MLVIRKEQFAAFERALVETFVSRAAEWVAAHHPEQARARGAEGVRASIRAALDRAAGAGIVDEPGVMLFVRAVYERGDGFHAEPWAAFLDDPSTTPARKIVLLASALYEAAEE
jgi:hypothetical protein